MRPRRIAAAAGCTLAFAVAHFYSYFPQVIGHTITPVWPVSALLLGLLLVRPRRDWLPLVLIASAVALAFARWYAVGGWPRNLYMIGVNALQVVACARVILGWCGPEITFRRRREVLALVAVCAFFNLAATMALAPVAVGFHGAGFLAYCRQRWISQCVGMIALAPLVVAANCCLDPRRVWRQRRVFEAAWLVAVAWILARIAFTAQPAYAPFLPAPYLALLPVVYGALRFGLPGASAALCAIGLCVTLGIRQPGYWPDAGDITVRVAAAQLFLGVVALTGLVLAAVIGEKESAALTLAEREERYRGMYEERERSEDELRRVNRILRTISACNVALARAATEEELLSRICEVVAASEGFTIAWVGMAEPDAAKTVRPAASAGISWAALDGLTISWNDGATGQGPAGRAIRTGEPSVYRDVAAEATGPWRDEMLRQGARSGIGLPLRFEGRVHGALSFYSTSEDAFVGETVKLLQEMADSDAAGMAALRAKERQGRAESEVRRLLSEAELGRRTLLSILEDRDLAERDKERSEERFRNAMLNAAIGMALISPTGRWLEVNPALCRIIGYTRDELLAMDFQAVTYPDDLEDDLQRLQGMLGGTMSAVEAEKRYVHKSGRPIWIRFNAALIRSPDGRPEHFVTQIQDITARRDAEAALESTVDRLQLALRASRLGIWRYNIQTRAVEWDGRMFQIFGLPPASRAPTPEEVLSLVAAEDQAAVRRSIAKLPPSHQSYEVRFRVGAGETERHVELHGLIRPDGRGRPEWVIGVARDLSDIVRATTESERLRAQLLQSQKMEALGTLAAGVAHDFNNLLTGINGFVELASATLGPGHEASELLKQARRGALSARDLVRRILSFSRSNLAAKRAPVEVADIVRDTAPLVAAALPANVSLSLAIAAERAAVLADAGQVQQILMNLCTNAAHAIGARAGQIEIAVRRVVEADADWVELAVADTGSGMDEATRKRIFEPFFTTKEPGIGTGLGLAIVQDIVKAHDGRLAVESRLGEGTVFRVRLPGADLQSRELAPVEKRIAVRGQGRRVLVIDDEPAIGTVVKLALEKHGFVADVHSSAVGAWEHFAAQPRRWSLVMVDQNMPDLTGAELIERIRGAASPVPVVMMSGRFETSGIGEGDHVVQLKKPFEIAELMNAVRAGLERSPVAEIQS